MARPPIEDDDIVHIYNRGTEKRIIFLDDQDHYRFIHYLYVCNDEKPLQEILESSNRDPISVYADNRTRLVNLLAHTEMPNHYHLAVHQKVERGISKYMQKLGVAITMYFNEKYKRTGALFQGKYKYRIVENEAQVPILIRYLHLNQLDILQPGWKDDGLKDKNAAIEFLRTYRWSSFPDYLGIKNFPSVLNLEDAIDLIGEPQELQALVNELTLGDLDDAITELILD